MSSYADVIEELGAAVDAGLLDREVAVLRLVEYSDGGLTHLGAADTLVSWQTYRARMADLLVEVEMGIAACEAAIRRVREDRHARYSRESGRIES